MHRTCPQCHEQYEGQIERCPTDGTPLADTPDPLIGQLLADRYRIQRVLGEGGMGRVYLAEHERMGRLSAVKVMSPSLATTAEAVSRFNREAANASRIHQPNVAAIYDFGETADGILYLAMEYVEGETLSALIRREGPLPPPRAAELAGQIADGLHAAHHLGIVHRDLKPDNILATRNLDGREWVKIVDFGIAKQTSRNDQTVTSLGVAVGTPDYMSPEQLAGETLDARTDLYSLGLVLFNMLTGQLPHSAMTSKQSLVQRLTARPRTLAEVMPAKAWHPRLQKALDRALAPEVADRYTSVIDFARDVRAAVGMPSVGGGAATVQAAVVVRPLSDAKPRPAGAQSSAPARKGHPVLVTLALLMMVGGAAAAMQRERVARMLHDRSVHPRAVATPVAVTPVDSTPAADSVSTPVVHADSAGVAASGVLSPALPGQRLEHAALQAERKAAGDTASAEPHPAVMQSAEDDAREVMVHVNRARELTNSDQLPGAGLELRTAYQEYRIFLTEHAAAPQVETLRRDLQLALDGALAACNAEREADVASGGKGFRCEHPAKTGVLVAYDVAPPAARVKP